MKNLVSLFFLMLIIIGCSNQENPVMQIENLPPIEFADLNYASDGEIKISWKLSTKLKFDGFKIYQKLGELGTFQLVSLVDRSMRSFTDKGLEYSSDYSYAISTYNVASEGVRYTSDKLSFIRPLNVRRPEKPVLSYIQGHNLIDIKKRDITFRWEGRFSSDVSRWRIFRCGASEQIDTTRHLLAICSDSTYVDSSIQIGKYYKYSIESLDKGGRKSGLCDEFVEIALASPNVLSPSNNGATSTLPEFTWQVVYGAKRYKIFIYDELYSSPIFSAITEATTFKYSAKQPELGSGKNYFLRIGAISKETSEINSISDAITFFTK